MSSKRAQRRKSCTGKRRYSSQADALAAARGVMRATAGGWLTAYHCRFCNGYHYGHPPRRVRQAIAGGRV